MALTLGDNFSYQGAKPLDARLKYDTLASMKAVADSTMYDGCMAYCTATSKTYQWKSTNEVDPDTGKWREYSSGGGHEIKDNGVAVTDRKVMNFTDFDIADDSTNEETDIKAHRLTSEEFSDICSPLPGAVSDMPILFDETGAEYIVGWYKYANGTKKPVYQRCFTVSNTQKPQTILLTDAITRSNSYLVNGYGVKHVGTSGDSNEIIFPYAANATGQSSDAHIYINQNANGTYITTAVNIGCTFDVTIQYTKNTDTPV